MSPVLSLTLLFQLMWTSLFGAKKAKFTATGLQPVPQLRQMLTEVKELIEEGHLKSIMDRSYSLNQVAEAHRYVDSGHKRGNIVMTI